MKTNLFHFFNAIHALISLTYFTKTHSLPDIIFENATPNNTWVFESETSQNALCEYDSCHLVLDPGALQWVAFPNYIGVESIIYKICDTSGEGAVIYGREAPKCTFYSGAKINVTSTLYNVTAVGVNNSVQSVEVYGNETSYSYKIVVKMLAEQSNYPTSFPSYHSDRATNDSSLLPALLSAAALVTFIALCIKYRFFPNKEEKSHLISNQSANYFGSIFKQLPPLYSKEKTSALEMPLSNQV